MKIRYFRACVAGLILSALLALPAAADELSQADRQQFQDIISSQIEAFQADDGAGAYAFAAPRVKRIFPTADVFMTMVRQGYQPVYRPQSVKFGEVNRDLGAPTQHVHLIGPKGQAWTALYAMQRQDDGSWRIAAVVLVKNEDVGA